MKTVNISGDLGQLLMEVDDEVDIECTSQEMWPEAGETTKGNVEIQLEVISGEEVMARIMSEINGTVFNEKVVPIMNLADELQTFLKGGE